MANAIVKFYLANASTLNQIQKQDGQIIFCQDLKKIYLDMHGQRTSYDTIQVFATDEIRQNLLAPVEGFYFVESTHILWRYASGVWKQISPANVNPIYAGGRDSFPVQGEPNVLYVTDTAIYKWDNDLNDYMIVSNKIVWEAIGGGVNKYV